MAKKILIIEDDLAISEMYRFKLENSGYTVGVVYDGVAGLDGAQRFRPDMILLDLHMPEMPGETMLTKLRGTDWGKQIKVIVLTNTGTDQAPLTLRYLNVDRYIIKADTTPADIVTVVQEILEKRS